MTMRKETTTIIYQRRKRPLFAMLNPAGKCVSVVAANDLQVAWYVATDWEDREGIEHRKRQGWRVVPATVSWEEGE